MNEQLTLAHTLLRGLTAWALILQSVEFWQGRWAVKAHGIWTWAALQKDFDELPVWLRAVFSQIMADRFYTSLIVCRGLLALALLFCAGPLVPALLLLITLVFCVRFRGTYNGGSDYMTVVILVGLVVAGLGLQSVSWLKAGLGYVAAQCVLSYFVAGLVKIRQRGWRNGRALIDFLSTPLYGVPEKFLALLKKPGVSLVGAWLVISFEMAAPLLFVFPSGIWLFLPIVITFHLSNVYLLGLNRFFWIWLASYPALWGFLTLGS